jgi:hypothetical protein
MSTDERLQSRLDGPFWAAGFCGQCAARSDLLAEAGNPDGPRASPVQVTLLSPVTRKNSCLAGLATLGGCAIHDLGEGAVSKRRKAVLDHATIQAFKGLENNVIVLHDVTQVADDYCRSLLYVGMSRARERLFVLLAESCRDDYYRALREEMQRSLTP